MKSVKWALCALFAAPLLGCAVTPEDAGDSQPSAAVEASVTTDLDTSKLVDLKPMSRPVELFDAFTALSEPRLEQVFLGQDKLIPVGVLGRQTLWESSTHRLQKSEAAGEMYLRLKEELVRPVTPSETISDDELQDRSLDMLRDLGLPEGEIGGVYQRTVAKADAETKAHELHQYMTIVDRAFAGIPVRGSRAVVVYDLAGSVNHVMLHWRPVAPAGSEGEQWTTRMTKDEVVLRAKERLEMLGLGDRPARLSYQYVPASEPREDGSVAYALRCVAMVGVNPRATEQQRPVEIDVELD